MQYTVALMALALSANAAPHWDFKGMHAPAFKPTGLVPTGTGLVPTGTGMVPFPTGTGSWKYASKYSRRNPKDSDDDEEDEDEDEPKSTKTKSAKASSTAASNTSDDESSAPATTPAPASNENVAAGGSLPASSGTSVLKAAQVWFGSHLI